MRLFVGRALNTFSRALDCLCVWRGESVCGGTHSTPSLAHLIGCAFAYKECVWRHALHTFFCALDCLCTCAWRVCVEACTQHHLLRTKLVVRLHAKNVCGGTRYTPSLVHLIVCALVRGERV